MFLKNFRVKSNTAIRGSDRRKLRNDILRAFPYITQEIASAIIPNKDDMSVMKIMTHSGQNVTAYTVNGSPILFQIETKLYPTVYLLWEYPDMIPTFVTWPNVFEKLRGGADLMLPGIIQVDTDEQEFPKEQVCSVALLGNRAPVAVGYTIVSSSEAREQGMRGKGVIILHSYLDQLWSQGSKCDIPVIAPNLSQLQESKDTTNDECSVNQDLTVTDSGKSDTAEAAITEPTDSESNETLSENLKDVEITEYVTTELSSLNPEAASSEMISSLNRESEECCSEDTHTTLEDEVQEICPVDSMDELLEKSFMYALFCVKNHDLPILTSTFYKNHLLPCCPESQILDIKKSSYKKLTKFLQVMENRNFIAMKEQSKGVHCIDSINWANEDLKNFKKENSEKINENRQNDLKESNTVSNKYKPPEIEDVFAVSGSTRTLFESLGYSKGAILTAKEVRQVITDYIKSQELASTQNKRMVKLDPVLFSAVHRKGEDNYDTLSWDEVFKRIIDRMNPCHTVTFNGQTPITRKGKLELIEIKLEQRMGNKKVTLVHNLEYYGIDPGEFSHKLQLKAASSTSVSQLPGKTNPGQQVLIQGNQMLHVARTLQDDYEIAAKYINGLDKLKQSKNKNKK
ncbi:eukaryotic translation initiation factor 2D-like [Dendronephthya gigantea]|uniref:eukaryotic translation initiation factor 2D-like n=1 Tax=Dendronephthya gigantea TaxID=151771 RepID=UPI00106CA452|nr:eukaryotic translation initiation factor 2D-like [Dendronephthya gigantea]